MNIDAFDEVHDRLKHVTEIVVHTYDGKSYQGRLYRIGEGLVDVTTDSAMWDEKAGVMLNRIAFIDIDAIAAITAMSTSRGDHAKAG